MLTQAKREVVNRYLGGVMVAARKANGLDVSSAATMTGFSEAEYRAIETIPSMISVSILNKIMTAFGAQYELADASNRVTAIIHGRDPFFPEPDRRINFQQPEVYSPEPPPGI